MRPRRQGEEVDQQPPHRAEEVLNLAAEWDVIPKASKMKGFKVKNDDITEDQFLTFDEAERLVRAAAPEWRTFIITALKTGLRVGELLALRWETLDLAGPLVVRRSLWRDQEGTPKGGRNREVPLSERDRDSQGRTGTSRAATSSARPTGGG